jgi:hypothetical protein
MPGSQVGEIQWAEGPKSGLLCQAPSSMLEHIGLGVYLALVGMVKEVQDIQEVGLPGHTVADACVPGHLEQAPGVCLP